MKKTYKRITLNERIIIETLLHKKRSKSYIANHLKRARSTFTNELQEWLIKPTDKYNAQLANWCAVQVNLNKRTLDKINSHKRLKSKIKHQLVAVSY